MWILAACLSALFAGLTAVLAKAGVASTSSSVATALRTVVVAAGAWGMAALTGTIFENPLAAVLFVMLMPMRRRLCLTTGYQVILMRARLIA